ncbi:MAG: YkgJ family cysteine cluster protein [Synergistaceae bacterium]|nr:YkgJ family cysteine cluster protein [Synergistaceae bacterium]MBR0096812.1 YkgJ family cysteine cluster protein [Synergistaceae bacterium]
MNFGEKEKLTPDYFTQWQKDLNSDTAPYKDYTNKGQCSNCGECCGTFLPVTKEDIAVIKEYIKTNNITPCYHGAKDADYIIDEICPFLNSAKKCSIYEVRPLICRFFKCNRKRIPARQQNFFAKQKIFYTNLWAEFFDDHRADVIFEKVRAIFEASAINKIMQKKGR